MRLQTKVLLALGSSLLLTGLCVATYFGARTRDTLIDASKANLSSQVEVLTELIDAYRLQTERLANDHFKVLAQSLPGSWTLATDAQITTADKSFPVLKRDGKILNNDFSTLDQFTASIGSVATVFVRSGDDFARITTSLKNDAGQRAIGTLLDRAHPAYQALLAGKPFLGRARLFNRDFMTRYEAIEDERHRVIGALFIGVDFTQSFSALKDSIRKMRVGNEGYFFALDVSPGKNRGTAMIHPEADGKNLLSPESGTRAADDSLARSTEASDGFTAFVWRTPQGEQARFAAFRAYAPWSMQLYATVAEAEILLPARQAAINMGLIMMASLAAISLFAVWLVNRLVIRPLGGEPAEAAEAVRRIALGDLSARFDIRAGDTASLMASLQLMQTSLISIVREIREISDAAANRGDFGTKIALKDKAGFMAELATLLNKLSDVTESGLHDIAHVADALAHGDLTQRISETYPGLFGQTTSSVNRTVDALRKMVGDIHGLVAAAKDGDFSVKLVTDGQEGYILDLSKLLNQLSDTTEEGLEEIRRVAQALAAGDLSQSVSREFPGIFGQTTNSVNQTVDALTSIVAEIRTVVAAASSGDFRLRMQLDNKQGYTQELGLLLNQLSGVTEEGLNEIRKIAAALAQGDLTRTVSKRYPGIFGETTEGMNRTVENLGRLINEVLQKADAISLAAQELASGNRDLSVRTEEQASSLEETAASMEELSDAVKQNVNNAQQANTLAQTANTMASTGGAMVTRVVGTMNEIEERSRKIADILSLIDGIAFQTNILALNAAVEAARAGEQGRGFAVVASEVRNLAQRSATASKEIKALITASVEKIDCGARQVGEAGQTMQELVASFQSVTSLISEINLASHEQGQGIDQVAKAVGQMDEVTQQNAALVEQAAAATESLEAQAKGLQQAVAVFRVKP